MEGGSDRFKDVAQIFILLQFVFQVTLQYIAPMVLILYLTLMYKTMGGESWSGFWLNQGPEPNQSPVTYNDPVSIFK